MLKVGVVVPSNRPERREGWMAEWSPYLWPEKDNSYNTSLYWIEDQPEMWEKIKRDLGKDAWIIPVKTDCIRSYGYLQAFRDGCQVTITLDDDTSPGDVNVIKEHVQWINHSVEPDDWVRTLRTLPTRGLPRSRHVVVNHGLWVGVPDITAKDQLEWQASERPLYHAPAVDDEQIIPTGKYYPMSGMNLAFDTRMTRFMYFTLQGYDIRDPQVEWGLHRCGDILAGVFSKTVIDNFKFASVHSGTPYVIHQRASNPEVNFALEANTHFVPEIVADRVKGAPGYLSCAERLYDLHVGGVRKDYFRNLANAMKVWYNLCKGEPGEYSSAGRPTPSGPVPQPQDATPGNPGLAESQVVS